MRDPSEVSVQYLKGVGPSKKKLFNVLGVETLEDLMYFFPRRYEDRTVMSKIKDVRVGEWQTVVGRVLKNDSRQSWFTKKRVCEVAIGDETGELVAIWFNQPYIPQYFTVDQYAILYGKVEMYKNRLQMVSPEYEILGDAEDESLSIGRIVPIYPLTRGITQRYLRRTIKTCLDKNVGLLKEVLPFDVRERHQFSNLSQSLVNLHFPESYEQQQKAYKRISFEEFFLFQVSVNLRRQNLVEKTGIVHKVSEKFLEEFFNAFGFQLTQAQKRVIKEIASDLSLLHPMHRLLQGDVGSGKTIVAFFGCVAAKKNGYQSAFMAPTEILARQHFEVLQNLIASGQFRDMRLALLINSVPEKEREEICEKIKMGEIDLVIGTHALIQEAVSFKNLSFVVVDEQHKFGVRQRSILASKGINPDVLVMTATPIPRTLCLTLYGDLDISTLDELPPGRGTIKTVHFYENDSAKAYALIKDMVRLGRQAYIVYPIIEESEKLDVKAAKAMYKQFKENEFKEFRIGLVHGQLKKKEAETVMSNFKNGKIDILIATTILEVGIDVANATAMAIEHADRFGLAQLHQLRGRIGRGKSDSTCILIADPTTPDAKLRIEAILKTNDGFKIAEQDLLIRGPGEFFGRHQHGINELKIANPLAQLDILEIAKKEAFALMEKDSSLERGGNTAIKSTVQKRYPSYLAMTGSG